MSRAKTLSAICSALLATGALAEPPVAEVTISPQSVYVVPLAKTGEGLFSLVGPDGFRLERTFQASEALEVPLVDAAGQPLGDGDYGYEVRLFTAPEVQEKRASAIAPPDRVQSGMFRIAGGQLMRPDALRADALARPAGTRGAGAVGNVPVEPTDFVLTENLIGRSACLSSDALCANGEALGIIDVKMKGNIPLIRWERTGAGDKTWDIDVDLGGFRIAQVTDGRAPLLISDSAPSNSVRVDGFGRVGLGTSLPAENLHVVDSSDASLRLQVGGQSWDIFTGSGSTSLRVFNATGGGIPFEIVPGASRGIRIAEHQVEVEGDFVLPEGEVQADAVLLASSRQRKERLEPVNANDVLARLATLPIYEWSFRHDARAVRHIGPVAEDFHAAFPLEGQSPQHLSVTDLAGVTLAAVQALNRRLDLLEKENRKLAAENARLSEALGASRGEAVDAAAGRAADHGAAADISASGRATRH